MPGPGLLAGAVAAYAGCAYVYDVLWRPHVVAKRARIDADLAGKPLLNIGAGTPGSSVRSLLLGPTLWGDVNMDINAHRYAPVGPDSVCYGDAHDIRNPETGEPYPDGFFGAVVASHVIEHVEDPDRALAELARVAHNGAQNVHIIVPLWWCPHTWGHPGHRWYFDKDGGKRRLW